MSDFGVNCVEFQTKDDQTICSLCGDQAAFIPCIGYLILEKEPIAKKKKNYLEELWYALLTIRTNK